MYVKMTDVNLPENIYLFKVNKRNNRKKIRKVFKVNNKHSRAWFNNVVLVTLNILHTFF